MLGKRVAGKGEARVAKSRSCQKNCRLLTGPLLREGRTSTAESRWRDRASSFTPARRARGSGGKLTLSITTIK